MTMREFLESDTTFSYPPPGGSIHGRASTSNSDADYYLSEIAAMIKRRRLGNAEATEVLWMKLDQIKNQEHYGQADDAKIIERLGEWIRELAH